MSYKVDNESIEKFHKDRMLLPYDDKEIAARMQIGRASYSSYKHGRYPITINFLRKFYGAFDQELSEIKRQNGQEDSYNSLQNDGEMFNELNKKYTALAEKYHKVLEDRLELMDRVFDLERRLYDLMREDQQSSQL